MADTSSFADYPIEGSQVAYKGFAGPFVPLDSYLFHDVVVTSAQHYLRFFVEAYEPAIFGASPDLFRLLQAGSERLADFDVAWDFATFATRECLLQRAAPDVALEKAIQLGLRFAASGEGGSFQVRNARPLRPIWGSLVLPSMSVISVESDAISAALVLDETSLELRRHEQGWTGDSVDALPVIRQSGICAHIVTPAAAAVVGCECVSKLADNDVSRLLQLFGDALALIEEGSPSYLPWIGRVLRHISPIEANPGVMRSGSGPEWPGLAEMSFLCDPISIAEMLIHECSHQYFNALMMISPVADGSDKALYFSPVRNCGRPIEMILLAYHAFGNVLLFYRDCQSRGIRDGGFCERNEAELLPQLKILEDALRTTRSLTEVGHSLWRPLAPLIESVKKV